MINRQLDESRGRNVAALLKSNFVSDPVSARVRAANCKSRNYPLTVMRAFSSSSPGHAYALSWAFKNAKVAYSPVNQRAVKVVVECNANIKIRAGEAHSLSPCVILGKVCKEVARYSSESFSKFSELDPSFPFLLPRPRRGHVDGQESVYKSIDSGQFAL